MIYKCWKLVEGKKCMRPSGHKGECNPVLNPKGGTYGVLSSKTCTEKG